MASDAELERLRALVGDVTFDARFEVLGAAGAGGMGEVVRARDRDSGRDVAVKLLAGAGLPDRARFAAEAEILERLRHPAIVGYIAHGVTGRGQPYLAMEWLDGESLASRLRRGPLTPDEAVVVGRRLASALAYAHEQGVIHRDVKPSNVMLLDGALDGARLIDFGVAKGHDRDLTHTGQVIGTPGYMAPEQALSRREVDGRADLFALGCTLYEGLAGASPFAGDEVMEVLARLLLHEPPPLARRCPAAPPRLVHLIAVLMAKEPTARLGDAAVVEAELAAIAAARAAGDAAALARRPDFGLPTAPAGADPPTVAGSVSPSRARPGRRRAALVALGATLVATIGALVVVFARPKRAPAPPPRVVAAAGEPCDVDARRGCADRCTAGDAEACYYLGDGHARGFAGLARDGAAAVAALVRGCELGSGRACTKAGVHALDGLAGDDPAHARAIADAALERGCQFGSGNTCRRLGLERLAPDGRLAHDDERALTALVTGCELADYPSCWVLVDLRTQQRGSAAVRARAGVAIAQACANGARHRVCEAATP